MKSRVPQGVRKGAWTEEEDLLLKKYIEVHGEGKWHQVPLRAGLNRCRKSCRLRWLNYLRPNIKRGDFTSDEVDLIVRLHKLLGNRWSLIAGRLPGRTANDVKNYWNTHLLKKLAVTPNHQVAKDANQTAMKTTIIRPRPRTFSKNPSWLKGTHTNVMSHNNIVPSLENRNKASPTVTDDSMHWWDDLVVDEELGQGVPFSLGGSEEPRTTELWTHELLSIGTKGDERFVQKGDGGFSDYSMNMDIWDLLSSDQLLA